MDIWTVLKACARRWYVFVPVLGLAVGLAYMQMQAAPPAYLATSSAALTGPALVAGDEPGEVIEVNPFESLGGSLTATTKVLVSLMDSAPKRDQFLDEGVQAGFDVTQDEAVIYFDVYGEDPDEVVASARRLVEILDVEMATLQGRAVEAPESRIRAVAVTLPETAEEDPVAGIRVFAIIAALGLVLAVAAALVADALVQGYRRRQGATGGSRRPERRRLRATRHAAGSTATATPTGAAERDARTTDGTRPGPTPEAPPADPRTPDAALSTAGQPSRGHGADA